MLFVLVVLALASQAGIDGKSTMNTFAGPFMTYAERFYMCEPPNDSQFPWIIHLRASHFNPYRPKELQLLTGNLTAVNVTMDDGFWIKLMLSVWSNNQWKDNSLVFLFKDKACTNFKVHLPGLYKSIFGPNLNLKEECLLKPGIYNLNNTPVDWTYTLNTFAGPYVTAAERFYMCEPPNYPWRIYLRASHFNPYKPKELQLLSGNLTAVNVTVDDSFWMKVMLAVWSNNQWKENSLLILFKDKACTNFKVHLPGLYKITFGPNLNLKDECLLKSGIYTVNNTPIDWTFPKFPVLPYGRFKVKMTIGKAEQLTTCLLIELRHLPKME